MAAEWAFLEPWHAVLRDSIIPGESVGTESGMQVSFSWPHHCGTSFNQQVLTLRLHLEDVNLPLKQIQEAMELFTMLSLVNNRAFEELFRRPGRSGCFSFNYYPMWNVYLCGTLPSHGPAVVQPPGTWSSLCGFHGGRRYEEKSEFQVAMQRLKEMGMEEGRNDYIGYRTEINWVCKFQGARVIGAVRADEFVDTWNGFQTNLQRLFDTGVPPIVQLCLARDRAKLLDTWQQTCLADTSTQSATKHVYVTIQDLTRLTYSQDLGLGLIRTPTKSLRLIFDEEPCKSRDADTIQTITNLESLLSVVVCGRSICEATALASGVNYCELKIATMRVSKAVFAATARQ